MANIVIAWELGGGTGHLHTLAPVIGRLIERGHLVTLIARDLLRARSLLGQLPVTLFPAPFWAGDATALPKVASYADVLLRIGFIDPVGMATLVQSWLAFYKILQPALILTEHAPTALLAARVANLPCAVVGTGFTLPKAEEPFASITPWTPVSNKRLQESSRKALEGCNRVLDRCGGEHLQQLSDLQVSCFQGLITFAELDHYGPRAGAEYYGHFMSPDPMPRPIWPARGGPRIFVYMHHHFRHFAGLMQQLDEMGCPTLVVSPGISRQEADRYSGRRLRISNRQVDITVVAEEADAIFSHSPHGLVVELLRLGRASILLPNYVEQALMAYRVERQGLGVAGGPRRENHDYRKMVETLRGNRAIADNAAAFSRRYRDYSQEEAVNTLVQRLEECIPPY